MKWFRLHHNLFTEDTKFKRLNFEEKGRYLHLYYLASRSEVRGLIATDDDDIAYELEMAEEDWQTFKAKLKAKGLLAQGVDGVALPRWKNDQYESDSSTARVRRHRAKAKSRKSNDDETLRNVPETLQKRRVTPSDTDPDPESEQNQITDQTQEGKSKNFSSYPESGRRQSSVKRFEDRFTEPKKKPFPWIEGGEYVEGFILYLAKGLTKTPEADRRLKAVDSLRWASGNLATAADVTAMRGKWKCFQIKSKPASVSHIKKSNTDNDPFWDSDQAKRFEEKVASKVASGEIPFVEIAEISAQAVFFWEGPHTYNDQPLRITRKQEAIA